MNLHKNVKYYVCDLRDAAKTRATRWHIRPHVVFHIASPKSPIRIVTLREYLDSNVGATQKLLDACCEASVQVFVFTSSNVVQAGYSHVNIDETFPYHSKMGGWCNGYTWSKVLAEKAVIAANEVDGPMKTASIRFMSTYGERDGTMVPEVLDRILRGDANSVLGDGSNLMDFCWSRNLFEAHELAVKALLNPTRATGAVAGEIFNIIDGNPMRFWDTMRMYERATGLYEDEKDKTKIPTWFIVPLLWLTSWAYYVFTFNTRLPATSWMSAVLATNEFTYEIQKAIRVLGYDPVVDRETETTKAMRFELAARGLPLPELE